ncbi:1-deoxy-D-xylulose-5-phosphate reductoisomerase [Cloacibacillus evryensis]|uniref:1-deoxy-D-xylulose 5-phosphate reductoisomerase n=1 Tax=Cloacibacillus evryensis TaxID=508460 RepID=A0AAW5K6G3_9BACT|nr:1-deoxy-D-xylulose-5-phosphate reductoisomerase [Cloacibacillus evryensis]EHL65216.1 1-deoxy-D-xylulose 5-phosphate reductoisomerase [Synergistes sp. 3_1_syn1]MCQ4814313.1 1-deoxy-D-xylulose-5-phosphate reductoisomerase [Cloacibacillus evryensis]MEA5034281.1 1-deoxy-D-xylulose-5-phosphate reductoisomerase [Cloacibacillus evryensis]
MEKIRLAVTGATGSVGGAVLDICARFPRIFEIRALSARSNAKKLAELGRKHNAGILCLTEPEDKNWREEGFLCLTGKEGLAAMVEEPSVDHAVFASSGVAAIEALQKALTRGIDVSLANKESIVVAGPWVMPLVKRADQLRPVDSEHSALWQCLRDAPKNELSRVWLTASGGPFRDYGAEEMERVTPEAALKHPVWKMGPKITVDSATLMNKGIECIEAMQLFDLPAEKVGALIHPRSQVHGMVEFIDGTVKLLLSQADMRLPAAAAIAWPKRLPLAENGLPPIEPAGWELDFREIDEKLFPCFALAREAGRLGGAYPALLVGADESAVKHFLGHEISYRAIAEVISEVLGRYGGNPPKTLEEAVALVEEGEKTADKICRDRRNR